MRSWSRLYILKDKLRNYLFLKNSNINNSTGSRAKLIVASTSLLCTSAYFYYVNKNHNKTSNVLAAKTLDCLNEEDADDLKLYYKRKECNRLIRRYKVRIKFKFSKKKKLKISCLQMTKRKNSAYQV